MSTAKMAEYLENTEDWDPITPQIIQSVFKNDSRAMESLGKKWNIAQLEQDARYNQQNPEEGIADASKATALGFLGAGIGNYFQGPQYVDQIGNAAEGQWAGQGVGRAGLLNGGMDKNRAFAMKQAVGLMSQPEQQYQAPPPPTYNYQQQPMMMSPYMSEEEKARLRAMGYQIPY